MAVMKLKKRSRIGLGVILIVVMLICLFVFWKTRQLGKEREELDRQLAQIQDQIYYENKQNQTIQNEIKYRQTKDYIEDQARDTFGLRDPDEIIFKPGETDESE